MYLAKNELFPKETGSNKEIYDIEYLCGFKEGILYMLDHNYEAGSNVSRIFKY